MSTSRNVVGVLLPVCLAIVCWYMLTSNVDRYICHEDHRSAGVIMCRPECPAGQFSLYGMTRCQPWLSCHDIESNSFKREKLIGAGAVKKVYRAEWKGYTVVLNSLAAPKYREDFMHGFSMLTAFQQSNYVTQILGSCGDSYVTEYHRLGSAERVNDVLQSPAYSDLNNIKVRLHLCISYAEIINFFHNSPLGTRVMCDSNDLNKTLSQYLLQADLSLVANDLDALPQVNRSAGMLIKCGHREIMGDFPAPEQLWPYPDHNFSDVHMPPYDEKTDIWKIPDVCDHFLGNTPASDTVRFHLFKIHRQCKQLDPEQRPTARDVLEEYEKLHDILDL